MEIGALYLRHPVFVAQDDGDLVKVEPEQDLQLPYARHPGQVVFRITAHPAGRAAAGGDQAELLVVTQRPLRDSGASRGGADAEQPLALRRGPLALRRGPLALRRRPLAGGPFRDVPTRVP